MQTHISIDILFIKFVDSPLNCSPKEKFFVNFHFNTLMEILCKLEKYFWEEKLLQIGWIAGVYKFLSALNSSFGSQLLPSRFYGLPFPKLFIIMLHKQTVNTISGKDFVSIITS